MLRLAVVLFLFSPFFLHAQNVQRIKGTVVLNGKSFKEGDSVYLGKPLGEKSTYKYIILPVNHLLNEDEKYLPASYEKKGYVISKFSEGHFKKGGFRKFIVLNIDKRDYLVDAETALSTGELIANNRNNELVEQIEKITQLYKSGLLTDEEFKKAKAKLLN